MINEVELFYDSELKNKIDGEVSFEPVPVGESTEKRIYLKNRLNVPIKNLIISLEGENVKLSNEINFLEAFSTKEIILTFEPKLTLMKPITAKLNIKGNYIIG